MDLVLVLRYWCWGIVLDQAAFAAGQRAMSPQKSSPFDYNDPDGWTELFPTCADSEQSPIDFRSKDMVVEGLPPLVFRGHWDSSVTGSLTNTGHTAKVRARNWTSPAVLSGGPLTGRYLFADLHFHWGANSSEGSEHTVAGRRYSAEAHAVHFKEEYGNLANAVTRRDGVAVVAFFMQARRGPPNMQLMKTSLALPLVSAPRSSVPLRLVSATGWFKSSASSDGYYTYPGSLTTPPCAQAVTWIVYPRPVTVSESQVVVFRSLKTGRWTRLRRNFRPVQPLNDRRVSLAVQERR